MDDAAKAPYVYLRAVRLSVEKLGGFVARGANPTCKIRATSDFELRTHVFSQAKIADLDDPVIRKDDVARLEIAMVDSIAMGSLQSEGNLVEDFEHL